MARSRTTRRWRRRAGQQRSDHGVDWHDVGGGESGWIAPDPSNSRYVYAGSYDGLLTRYDHQTGRTAQYQRWPDNPMGSGVEAMKYRFQWNFPLLFSPNDPKLLYAGSECAAGHAGRGQSWTAMSPDLTRNDKSKQGPVGGPITKDNTAVEYYDTIFTVDESTVAKGLIWAGSDDGLIHVTRDGGKSWQNVTPKGIPEWIRINCIAASPFDAGTAYVAATMYLSDDFHPFLYRTTDYGKTWKKIVSGIPDDDFTRAIRPDPKVEGAAVRRNGGAPLRFIRRRRSLGAVPVEPTECADHGYHVSEAGGRPGDCDAGAGVLRAGRHADGARAGGGQAAGCAGPSVRAEGCLPLHGGAGLAEVWPGRWVAANPPSACGDLLHAEVEAAARTW